MSDRIRRAITSREIHIQIVLLGCARSVSRETHRGESNTEIMCVGKRHLRISNLPTDDLVDARFRARTRRDCIRIGNRDRGQSTKRIVKIANGKSREKRANRSIYRFDRPCPELSTSIRFGSIFSHTLQFSVRVFLTMKTACGNFCTSEVAISENEARYRKTRHGVRE